MPRYKLTIEYDGAPYSRLAAAGERPFDSASAEEPFSPDRRAAQRRTAPAAPTPGCMRAARSRMSILSGTGPAGGCARRSTRISLAERISVVEAERAATDFDARRSAIAPPLSSIVDHQPPRAAGVRARPRLAGEAAARRRRHARGRASADRPSRFLDLSRLAMPGEFAAAHARLFRGRRARATKSASMSARVRFCIGRCARWSARSSRSARGKWSPADFHAAFEAADRSRCGQVAPPDGLYLERVDYPSG